MSTAESPGAPVRLSFDVFELDEGNARLTRAPADRAAPKAFADGSWHRPARTQHVRARWKVGATLRMACALASA